MSINHVTYFTTGQCNLACSYCFQTLENARFHQQSRRSTPEMARKVVDFLLSQPGQELGLGFFGGEPLLGWRVLREIVEYGERRAAEVGKRLNFSVTTNATVLSERVAAYLKAHNVTLLVSLDGLPRPCNQRRFPSGRPSAELALKNARQALALGCTITIRWTVPPGCVEHMAEDFHELLALGFRALALEPVYEMAWTEPHYAIYEQQLRQIADEYREALRAGQDVHCKPLDDAFAAFYLDERPTGHCGTATSGVSIDPEGRIYPCHRFVSAGGPVVGTLDGGWDEAALRAAQEWDIRKVRPAEGDCRNCPVKIRCTAGCLVVNQDLYGDIYTVPPVFCRLQNINQRVANDVALVLYAEKNPIFLRKVRHPEARPAPRNAQAAPSAPVPTPPELSSLPAEQGGC